MASIPDRADGVGPRRQARQFHLARRPDWVFCTRPARVGRPAVAIRQRRHAHRPRSALPVLPPRALPFTIAVEQRRVRLLRSFSSVDLAGSSLFSTWIGRAARLAGGGLLVDRDSIPRVSPRRGALHLARGARIITVRRAPPASRDWAHLAKP